MGEGVKQCTDLHIEISEMLGISGGTKAYIGVIWTNNKVNEYLFFNNANDTADEMYLFFSLLFFCK